MTEDRVAKLGEDVKKLANEVCRVYLTLALMRIEELEIEVARLRAEFTKTGAE